MRPSSVRGAATGLLLAVLILPAPGSAADEAARGDVDRSGGLNITDAIALLNILFLGVEVETSKPVSTTCFQTISDANHDRAVDIADAIFLLEHLFAAGPAPDPLSAAERAECGVVDPVAATPVTVRPTEINDLLQNPHRGIQLGRTITHPDLPSKSTLQGVPVGSLYRRWGWIELEPNEAEYQFDAIDAEIREALAMGVKYSFRVSTWGRRVPYTPYWVRDKGADGSTNDSESTGVWYPAMDDPIFLREHERFIRALGRHLGPDNELSRHIDFIEIGALGCWGEWNTSCDRTEADPRGFAWEDQCIETCMNDPGTNKTAEQCKSDCVSTRRRVVDMYFDAFPHHDLLMLHGDFGDDPPRTTRYATRERGAGMRLDGLGKATKHARGYKKRFSVDAPDAWLNAPIAGEAFGWIQQWTGENGWLTWQQTIDDMLDWNFSYFNWQEGTIVSEEMRREVQRMERKLGYRLVLRELTYPSQVTAGSNVSVDMLWENVGVAPPYFDYYVTFRFASKDGSADVDSGFSINGWLPGQRPLVIEFRVPDLEPGEYELAVGLVDRQTGLARILLGTERQHSTLLTGEDAPRWYSPWVHRCQVNITALWRLIIARRGDLGRRRVAIDWKQLLSYLRGVEGGVFRVALLAQGGNRRHRKKVQLNSKLFTIDIRPHRVTSRDRNTQSGLTSCDS